MKDTPADVEARFRSMILEQTPARRLIMSCRMFSTAKALIRAGILAESGGRLPDDLRQRIFRRLYSRDFDSSDLERILEHLGLTG